MGSAEPLVLREQPAAGVELLTLNRPQKLNALSRALLEELLDIAGELREREEVRAVVLTGAGRAFSAGGDLGELRAADPAAQLVYFGLYRDLHLALRAVRAPVLAALNGLTFAGGLELACMCDLRLAAREAILCVSDAPHGLPPTGGLTWTLPRLLRAGRARWLSISNARIDAEQALAFGLVDEVEPAERLRERAVELASQIAAYPGLGIELTRTAFDSAAASSLEQAMATEIELSLRAMEHPDVAGALDAFFQ